MTDPLIPKVREKKTEHYTNKLTNKNTLIFFSGVF